MPRYLLVAGFDFGTSFSKVVLREQNTRKAVVARFDAWKDGLLPSVIGFDGTHLFPPGGLAACEAIPYLKMLAAEVADGCSITNSRIRVPRSVAQICGATSRDLVCEFLSFYFAHLIAAVKQFIRSQSPWLDFDFTGKKSVDNLVFQLAVPSGLLAEGQEAERLFREAFIIGYELAPEADPDLRTPCQRRAWSQKVRALQAADPVLTASRYKWQCLLYPEVAAAVQTVFRSPNAKDGLYITMDVGAGTVDMNAFLRNTGQHLRTRAAANTRSLDYYAASVRPLGIHNLSDPYHAVESQSEAALMKELRDAVCALHAQAKVYQPNHGTNSGRRTWDRANFFIFGGGALHQAYPKNFAAGLAEAGISDAEILRLPAADLQCPPTTDFGRFAVAYGMSYFRPSLDEVRLPKELRTFRELIQSEPAEAPQPYGFNWDD